MRRETRSDAAGEQHARREIVRSPARVHLALVVAAQVDHRLEPQRVERGQILVARPFMVRRAPQYRVAQPPAAFRRLAAIVPDSLAAGQRQNTLDTPGSSTWTLGGPFSPNRMILFRVSVDSYR